MLKNTKKKLIWIMGIMLFSFFMSISSQNASATTYNTNLWEFNNMGGIGTGLPDIIESFDTETLIWKYNTQKHFADSSNTKNSSWNSIAECSYDYCFRDGVSLQLRVDLTSFLEVSDSIDSVFNWFMNPSFDIMNDKFRMDNRFLFSTLIASNFGYLNFSVLVIKYQDHIGIRYIMKESSNIKYDSYQLYTLYTPFPSFFDVELQIINTNKWVDSYFGCRISTGFFNQTLNKVVNQLNTEFIICASLSSWKMAFTTFSVCNYGLDMSVSGGGTIVHNKMALLRVLRLKSGMVLGDFDVLPTLDEEIPFTSAENYNPPSNPPTSRVHWDYTAYSIENDNVETIRIGTNQSRSINYSQYVINNFTYSNITNQYNYSLFTSNETYNYTVSEYSYQFQKIKGKSQNAEYYYTTTVINPISVDNLGDWGKLWNWLRNGIRNIVNFFISIINGIVLIIQFMLYFLLVALEYCVMYLICMVIVPFFWNTLVYWVIFGLIAVIYYIILALYLVIQYLFVGLQYVLNKIFVGIIILFVFIVNAILWLWFNVILPFLVWLWDLIVLAYEYLRDNIQPIVKAIIYWLIVIISFIEACLVWILVLGTMDFMLIYTNIYNFNTLIADFTIEFGTIFFENIIYFLMYIAMYLILMGFVLLKLIYCKSKGYSWRAYDLDNLLEAYKYPIKIVVSIVKYFKELIAGWI